MKDSADIWLIAQGFDFDGEVLAKAVANTFRHRRTELQPLPSALAGAFAQNETKQRQWEAFRRVG